MEIIYNNNKTIDDSLLNSDLSKSKNLDKSFFNKKTKSKEVSLIKLKNIIENNSILNYPYDFLSSKSIIKPIIKINLIDNINLNYLCINAEDSCIINSFADILAFKFPQALAVVPTVFLLLFVAL